TRRPRCSGVVGERARRDRSANRRLSRASPAIPRGEGALHGRAHGAVLPPRPRRVRGARGVPPLVPGHLVRPHRRVRPVRVERTGGALHLGFGPWERGPLAGGVLLAQLVRDAIERGRRTFDFLRGEERYKYEFEPVPEAVYTVRIR